MNNYDTSNRDEDYVSYEAADPLYGGAASVVNSELEHLAKRADATGNPPDRLVGLALSGGGIRSATFSLGAMQALARHGWLKKVDYLSTVSGGGYIGTSLSWLLHNPWNLSGSLDDIKSKLGWDRAPASIEFGINADSFPYGTHRKGRSGAASGPDKLAMLRFLRLHGKYLTPGQGIGVASLLAVVLRGMFLSLLVYGLLLTTLFLLMLWIGLFDPLWYLGQRADTPLALLISGLDAGTLKNVNPLMLGAVAGLALFALWSAFYSVMTYLASRPTTKESQRWYRGRRRFEMVAGYLLLSVAGLALIGSLPHISQWLTTQAHNINMAWLKETAGAVSTVAGAIAGLLAFAKSGKAKTSGIPMALLTWGGLILLSYGVVFLSYHWAEQLRCHSQEFWLWGGLLTSLAIIGWLANINYISIHRYYRDRLMEAFMPDVATALVCDSAPAYEADKDRLHEMCQYPTACGPYHIINSNVVLVDAKRNKYRARGGDNFILSPLYCGSSATGWRGTKKFMTGKMNLSTAMAISGAAVNPNTGSGGEGPTRNRLLSILMALLNIRLGYWAHHPNPQLEPQPISRPNYFFPGLRELFPGQLNEHHPFQQLSDGGHFENLAVYELIRRRLSLIIVCDGSADPEYTFSDFANLQEKVRSDFGVSIDIDFSPMMPQIEMKYPQGVKVAQSAHVIGKIRYPDDKQGVLLYLNTALTAELPADLYGYKSNNPSFPDQPTSDQFFDEKQFEAYRELGYRLAEAMIDDPEVINAMS